MKIYKIAIFGSESPFGLKTNYRTYSKLNDIWHYIKQNLSKKYKFKEYYFNYNDHEKIVEQCSQGKYDMVIAGTSADYKFYKKVNFTIPLYIAKPSVYYDPLLVSKIDWGNYLKNLVKLWINPFIFFSIIGIIFSLFFYYLNNKKNFSYNIYEVVSGFFGQTSGIVDNIDNTNYKVIIFSIFVLMVIFTTNLYISATTISESVDYFSNSNILEKSLKGLKVLVYPTNNDWIKSLGGIPVNAPKDMENDKFIDIYLNNKGIADCIVDFDQTYIYIKNNQRKYVSIKKSDINLGSYFHVFLINRKLTTFLKDINNEIIKLQSSKPGEKPLIELICSRYSDDPHLCNIH